MTPLKRSIIVSKIDQIDHEREYLVGLLNQEISRNAGIGDVKHLLQSKEPGIPEMMCDVAIIVTALIVVCSILYLIQTTFPN